MSSISSLYSQASTNPTADAALSGLDIAQGDSFTSGDSDQEQNLGAMFEKLALKNMFGGGSEESDGSAESEGSENSELKKLENPKQDLENVHKELSSGNLLGALGDLPEASEMSLPPMM